MDLVTGANGFVGSHMVEALVARGRAVRCLVRDRERARHLEREGVEVIACDLLDRASLARAFRGIERVYHLAGGGKVSAATGEGLAVLRAANVAPVETVVETARDAGVARVVHFSSISAMGIRLDVRLDETSPCRPVTPHEIAKHESEGVALGAWERWRVPVVVLRPSQIYGPRDVRSEILKLVRLARRGLVPLFDGGAGRVPWVYVSDVVDAALAAAERPEAVGQTYIVSDVDSYEFADVVRTIAAALGRGRGGLRVPTALAGPAIAGVELAARLARRDPPFTRHRLASMCGRRLLSVDKARREIGFAPRVGLRPGMERTVAWYRAQGLV